MNEELGQRWTCRGGVRGGCGVVHSTYDAALLCCDADSSAVKRGHGSSSYSDRCPEEIEPRVRRYAIVYDKETRGWFIHACLDELTLNTFGNQVKDPNPVELAINVGDAYTKADLGSSRTHPSGHFVTVMRRLLKLKRSDHATWSRRRAESPVECSARGQEWSGWDVRVHTFDVE